MTPEPTPSGYLPLPEQTILSLSGTDRLRFLNGQVTNDLRLVEGDACLPTAVLDAKGRLEAFCHLREIEDLYLIDAHPSLRESLQARLDRYLIADDAELTDVTDRWHLIHLLGPERPDMPDTFAFPVQRFGVPGIDILSRTPLQPDLPALVPEEVEALRISHGVPLWPHELQPGIFPAESGLDATAVSFDKGCYLGQEVVSRMKRAGKTNRHLVLLAVPPDTTPGTSLFHGEKEAGTITSVSPSISPDGTHAALAWRKRQHEGITTFTLTEGTATVVRQVT